MADGLRPDYSEAYPMAQRIAEKFRRKAKAAERRRLKREQPLTAEPASKAKEIENESKVQIHDDNTIILELNEATVSRLLWLKQNHKSWIKAINCIVETISGSNLPRCLRSRLNDVIDNLFLYLNPLISQASAYHQTPKKYRPRFATA